MAEEIKRLSSLIFNPKSFNFISVFIFFLFSNSSDGDGGVLNI